MQLKERRSGLESIFKLEFKLEGQELNDFHRETKIKGNEDIPITIKVIKIIGQQLKSPKKVVLRITKNLSKLLTLFPID